MCTNKEFKNNFENEIPPWSMHKKKGKMRPHAKVKIFQQKSK